MCCCYISQFHQWQVLIATEWCILKLLLDERSLHNPYCHVLLAHRHSFPKNSSLRSREWSHHVQSLWDTKNCLYFGMIDYILNSIWTWMYNKTIRKGLSNPEDSFQQSKAHQECHIKELKYKNMLSKHDPRSTILVCL